MKDERWYDALDHAYYVGDERWTSVTQALRAMIDDRWYTTESRERGEIVHAQASTLLAGATPSYALHEPYVRAAEQFVRLTTFRAVEVECAAWDDELRIAGRVDVFGYVDRTRVVVDWKTGGPAAWHALQVSQYAKMKEASEAWVVYLKNNGKPKVIRIRGALLVQYQMAFRSMI